MAATLDHLKTFDLVYLGTPYTKFPGGITCAFAEAAALAAKLVHLGIRVYSPIAHTHPLAIYGNLDPLDHRIWLPFDTAMMVKSDAMLVGMLPTWDDSYGVNFEIEKFTLMRKPVFYLDPIALDLVMR